MPHKFILFATISLFIVSTGWAYDCSNVRDEQKKWCVEQSQRELAVSNHFLNQPLGANAFASEAVGQGPYPFIMFRLFTDLMPEIWGTSEDNFLSLGLVRNPLAPDSMLPLGFAESLSVDEFESVTGQKRKIGLVGMTCVACHSGQVRLSDGKLKILWGAPNTRIESPIILLAKTALHPNFEAEKFRTLVAQKTPEWFYGPNVSVAQRQELLFFQQPGVSEALVDRVKKMGTMFNGALAKIFTPIMYAPHNNAKGIFESRPGSMDALFGTYLAFVGTQDMKNPDSLKAIADTLPKSPAETDNPSLWNQKYRETSHWDGSLPNKFIRNVGSASATLNKPVDIGAVSRISDFAEDLPSTPYPFLVDSTKAERGAKLFKNNCATCHSGMTRTYPAEQIGTDINRFEHMTTNGTAFLQVLLTKLCSDPKLCVKKDGTPYRPEELVKKSNGYIADRLDGIWARAPYLHNGSVPNLRALLTNNRPIVFYRGSLNYDEKNVGFRSDSLSSEKLVEYDTRLAGQSNSGHNSKAFLGLDWSKNPKKLDDLLDYLKTL